VDSLSILLCLALKNVLSYSYSLLFQWVNASISHRLHCGILHQLLSVGQSYLDAHDSGKLLNTLEHGHLACQFRVLDHG
jgi:ATP-binding cassette, subfamily B, bacterial MsbA